MIKATPAGRSRRAAEEISAGGKGERVFVPFSDSQGMRDRRIGKRGVLQANSTDVRGIGFYTSTKEKVRRK